MKRLNLFQKASILIAIGTLLGCGGAKVKQDLQADTKLEFVDTTIYIPVQQFDEKISAYLPYVPAENPYLAQKGRIKKEAITKYIQARRLYKAKNFQQVEIILEEVNKVDDSLSGPWIMRGDIAMQKEDLEKAITFYQKALQVNAKNINAYIKLAKAQRILGRFLQAQNTYANALAIWPDFPEAHLNLGILYDIYLNHPLRAQKHMQAYQFLTGHENKQVATWIAEIQARTGVKTSLSSQR